MALVSVAWAFEPIAVVPSLVACAHKPEPVASTPLTLLHVDATTLLIATPLVPRVCTVPLLLAPPIVVPPSVPPFAVAFFDASTSDVSVVDKEVVPLAMLLKPLEIDVTWLKPVDSDEMPVEREEIPLEVDDDKELTLPLVVDSPVDSELTFDVLPDNPVDKELMLLVLVDKPVEVDDDSEFTLLLVELRAVDSDPRPVDVAVDSEFSWLTLTASVFCVPAATLMICRSLASEPTETTLRRVPLFELAPIATELEPGLTNALSRSFCLPSALK
ncbi:hypothetical protein BCF11_1322 [Collimonas sp. PA-H2]|nr:hypothetical protein BCF11_1322 [Collimonas sp. PA-H2]